MVLMEWVCMQPICTYVVWISIWDIHGFDGVGLYVLSWRVVTTSSFQGVVAERSSLPDSSYYYY